ncbi:MAG: hypothetical protein JXR37_13720 [Kiritimatiellae bacterium]|nr:hypothetical protein [Kiritimatiellia bacterium]
MGRRDKFLKAMRRELAGHVPMQISLCPAQCERFRQVYGHADYAREWGLPGRAVGLPFHATATDFSAWHVELDGATQVDVWGIGHRASAGNYHFTSLLHPLAGADAVESIRDYPFPQPADDEDVTKLAGRVAELQAEDYVALGVVSPVGGTVFWPAYKLRGMENLLCDLYTQPELATWLLDGVTAIVAEQARQTARAGVDILHLADDLGTQSSTYMSPDMFREWIKPRLASVIRAAKAVRPDLLVHFHSDGAVQSLIPDMIEIGVDILNPVQPECMDPFAVWAEFGDRLSFSGCVGTQTILPFGSAADVRETVRRYCDEMGKSGGLWIGPSHVVEPEVPWANVMAFVGTAAAYA